jgi:hypothetical protein
MPTVNTASEPNPRYATQNRTAITRRSLADWFQAISQRLKIVIALQSCKLDSEALDVAKDVLVNDADQPEEFQ